MSGSVESSSLMAQRKRKRPPSVDVPREVQVILERGGMTFGALIVGALRDTTNPLGATVITELASILEALRPHLDEDGEARASFGRFFASITSPELLWFEKGGKKSSWNLSATSLSTEQLMGFSLEEMGKKIASGAPGLSSFLNSICGGSKPDGSEVDIAMDADEVTDDDAEEDSELRVKARGGVSPARLLEIRKITLASIILNTRNQKCNAFQVAVGVFLHSTHTPDRVVSALHRAGISISQPSIGRAIKSMSAKTIQRLTTLGMTLMLAYDNFDVLLKSPTTTLENNVDPLKHLTSALVFPFQHGVVPEDLRVSKELWELDGFNDKSRTSVKFTKWDMWTEICSRYGELVAPATEEPQADNTVQGDRHFEFRVWLFLRDLVEHGPRYFQKFRNELLPPVPVGEPIPVVKTEVIPLQSLDVSNSTVKGNIDTIEKLLEQTGLGEYEPPTPTISLDHQILLFHGDLGTGDRINSAKQWRGIEGSPRDRLQFVVFVMGLFHTKMACAETIWRTFLKNPKARSDKTSFYSDFRILRPRDSSGLASTFKFRPVHDAIRHVGICRRLDCMRVVAQEDRYSSLQAFADSQPNWSHIEAIAREAVTRFVPHYAELEELDKMEPEERDEQLENSMGFNIYSTLYEEMSYAMDHGDIGRVEMCLIAWAPLFEAAGKNKYAHHTIKLVHNLNHVFPARMSHAIRMHILINPTGQPGKFRAVDWVVELLNLFTKDTHSGTYSNKTVENILKESPLVETYRQLGKMIEDNFCTTKKTTKHQSPNMKRTFNELLAMMERNGTHVREQGRESEFGVNRNLEKGLKSIQQTAKNTQVRAGASENSNETEHEEVETGEGDADLDEEDLMLDDD